MLSMRLLGVLLCFICFACNDSEHNLIPNSNPTKKSAERKTPSRELSDDFKAYWFQGDAEITSYKLSQERYGELREGTVVNIFVTEDFIPEVQVKADNTSEDNISVLKLNQTKKYVTGIYPYSVMTSAFSPLLHQEHALKVSHSMQEWCGHVYMQLNNHDAFEITQHSYFQGEADASFNLEKVALESDVWNTIRINPAELPTGALSMLPPFEYFRMSHTAIAAHSANATLTRSDSLSTYQIQYSDLNRSLSITFTTESPHYIEQWRETHANGLVTSADKMKRLKTAYWAQNNTTFEHLRDSLGL